MWISHLALQPPQVEFKDMLIETFPKEELLTLSADSSLVPLDFFRPSSTPVPIFNKRNFEGCGGSMEYWSIDGDEIVGASEQPLGVSTYLLTDKVYTDFRLRVTVKLALSEMHSGITLWGRQAPGKSENITTQWYCY